MSNDILAQAALNELSALSVKKVGPAFRSLLLLLAVLACFSLALICQGIALPKHNNKVDDLASILRNKERKKHAN